MKLKHNITKLSRLIFSESSDDSFLKDESKFNINYYKKNYIFSLLSSMKASYPCVLEILGEDNFSYFAYQYIKENKSSQSNIDLYGDMFSHFLITNKVLENKRIISYLASIDWLLHCEETNHYIEVPRGILQLWRNLIFKEEVKYYNIDEAQLSKIELKLDSEGELFLQEE